jgi:hypothetical protein
VAEHRRQNDVAGHSAVRNRAVVAVDRGDVQRKGRRRADNRPTGYVEKCRPEVRENEEELSVGRRARAAAHDLRARLLREELAVEDKVDRVRGPEK